MTKMKVILSGDAMIPGNYFEAALKKHLAPYVSTYEVEDWETDWPKLQDRRLIVEQQGPEVEVVPEVVLKHGHDADVLMGLFVPVSKKVMEAMPNLRLIGLSRAGLENLNLEEATKRGILAFNIMGRNAEAVSDFTVGMMLAEARNIARAHESIKRGEWRKKFANGEFIMQLKGKKIGLAGFGYIGQLVAKKLSGFGCEILVYEAFKTPEEIKAMGYTPVDKETLFKESDIVSLHLRMTDATKHFVNKEALSLMKPTSIVVNTARAGLVDMDALYAHLSAYKIAGAALDVFEQEPLAKDDRFVKLDNVTLTTHIAGTTTEALTGSPFLLMEDIERLLKGEKPHFIVNPEVLDNEDFKVWLNSIKAQ